MVTSKSKNPDLASKNIILYKYRVDNEYTERLFSTRRVWLSTAAELNDPFECSLQEIAAEWIQVQTSKAKTGQFFGFIMSLKNAVERGIHYYGLPPGQLSDMRNSLLAEKTFEVAYRRMRNFVETSGMTFSNPDYLFTDLDDRLNSVGIFSMTECPDNDLMWAHYSGHHTGICLGFLTEAGCVLEEPTRCFPVRYTSEVPTVPAEGLKTTLSFTIGANGKPISTNQVSFDDPTFQAAVATKAECWAYEQEWRYAEPIAGEYPWPGPLREITFGLRCKQQRREFYTALAEEFAIGEVNLFEMQKVPNSNKLVRMKLGKITGRSSCSPSSQEDEPMSRVARGKLFHDYIEQLLRGGDFEESLSILDQQLEQNPDSIPLLYQKGIALGYKGDHESALLLFERCCTQAPNDPTTWYQKGVALSELGRQSEAIHAYRKARELDPHDASTEFNLGSLLISAGLDEEGIQHLKVAAKNGHQRASQKLQLLSLPDAKMPQPRDLKKVGRNEPCPCGSGNKYKKCHGK